MRLLGAHLNAPLGWLCGGLPQTRLRFRVLPLELWRLSPLWRLKSSTLWLRCCALRLAPRPDRKKTFFSVRARRQPKGWDPAISVSACGVRGGAGGFAWALPLVVVAGHLSVAMWGLCPGLFRASWGRWPGVPLAGPPFCSVCSV